MLRGQALSDLTRRTRSLAMRFDQVRRDTIDFGVPADCPNTARRVAEIEADAATLAELETTLAEIRRTEREGRPLLSARRPSLYVRTMEALSRISPTPDMPVRLSGDR